MKTISVTLTAAAMLAGLAYWYQSTTTATAISFDQLRWIEASTLNESNDPGCYRGGMAMDLVERRVLTGKTGPEVISLLGKPSNSSAGSWIYPVGQCGMLWDHFDLRIAIDPEEKVIHAAIVKDER